MTTRRAFLAAGGTAGAVGLGGCLDELSLRDGDPSNVELAVTDIDDAADEHGIALDVAVSNARLDGDEIPELYLEIENVGERLVRIDSWSGYRVGEFASSEPSGLHTFTMGETDQYDLRAETCWSFDEEYLERTSDSQTTFLEADDVESESRHVLRHGRDFEGDCPEPGEYAFESSYQVYDLETEEQYHDSELDVTDGERVACRFTLDVTAGE
ncbi:hypothetical protein OB905_06205 [Halobacteria archaeon AArc-dxtr1]|nr:hypothetical protein [Halobacteria archaeon AArc-dxtr1]